MRKYIFPLVLVVLLASVHLYIFTRSIDLKYQTTRLKQDFKKVYQEMRRLNCEVAREEALGRVEKTSLGELKMEYPQKIYYIVASREAYD